MATVSLKNVKKIYDNKVTAVHDFNLEIADKEFIVLVGPSGCGKSTTLRMIAGLEDISEGDLVIGGKRMNDVEPKDRDIAMVFQSYALYPHMTVYENMAFALKLRKVPKEEIDKKVREAAEILDITQYLDRKPKALSGGQRQRVAIGRAIVRDPQVFLMDEPLSNLDAKLRNQMRAEIIKLRQRINTTFIYVTHDQTEAMTLGDRIVIMKDGFIQQIGTPQEVFDQPANLFVAGFIGSPQMNFFDGELEKKDGKYQLKVGEATVDGDTATVPVEFTYVNAGSLMTEILTEYISQAWSLALSGADDEKLAAAFEEVFDEKTTGADFPTLTATLTIPCVQTSDGWKISSSADNSEELSAQLLDILTSNIYGALEDFGAGLLG